MNSPNVVSAEEIISANVDVLYGAFGAIDETNLFPPRTILNEFLVGGYDPCDQDGRMPRWDPLELSQQDYERIKEWWIQRRPAAKEESLGASSWADWFAALLDH